MSKQRKKIHCTCKGKTERNVPGPDHQKHVSTCPMITQNRR